MIILAPVVAMLEAAHEGRTPPAGAALDEALEAGLVEGTANGFALTSDGEVIYAFTGKLRERGRTV